MKNKSSPPAPRRRGNARQPKAVKRLKRPRPPRVRVTIAPSTTPGPDVRINPK